jgi:predicted DNA-binding protein (MmcQ/YjbR family)
MNIETLQQYALSKPFTSEDMPFGDEVLVFRVMNKIFALSSLDTETARVNLKCDPDYAEELRESHSESIKPGFHMNKKHWNTVELELGLDEKLIRELIDISYDLVLKSIPKSKRLDQ